LYQWLPSNLLSLLILSHPMDRSLLLNLWRPLIPLYLWSQSLLSILLHPLSLSHRLNLSLLWNQWLLLILSHLLNLLYRLNLWLPLNPSLLLSLLRR
jgi:hypothetical protein